MTSRERAELRGYLSAWVALTRAALFLGALAVVGYLSRSLQLLLGLPDPLWLLPVAGAGALLFVRSRRWTGGRDLRNRMRLDLEQNLARVHEVHVKDAILFEEHEDEGPVVFVLDDDGKSILFTGQDLARLVRRGFPWEIIEIREGPNSGRLLGIRRRGAKFGRCRVLPPLSSDRYRSLGLASMKAWQVVDIPFDSLGQECQ